MIYKKFTNLEDASLYIFLLSFKNYITNHNYAFTKYLSIVICFFFGFSCDIIMNMLD